MLFFIDGNPVALAALVTKLQTADSRKKVLELVSVWVSPEHRSRGLASDLVRFAQDYSVKRGDIGSLRLDVFHVLNHAKSIYERCGFVEIGCNSSVTYMEWDPTTHAANSTPVS